MRHRRRSATIITITLAVILTATSLIGVAVYFFPAVRISGNEYGHPTPGWMYAAASVGAYVFGPLIIAISLRQKWGVSRYGAAISTVGAFIAFAAMCSKYADQGKLNFSHTLFSAAVILIPQIGSLGLIFVLQRNISSEVKD